MDRYREAISPLKVELPRRGLAQMVRLVRDLYRLSCLQGYRAAVAPFLPESARFAPGHDSVMMGYDFHWSDDGAQLIEVNTNAGGALLAWSAASSASGSDPFELPEKLERRVLSTFAEEMRRFSGGAVGAPRRVAIIDESPQEQFLHGEMLAFSRLFARAWNAEVAVVDPGELQAGADGVFHQEQRVDLVYNRHCDFYLESAEMAGLREAYLARSVCLSPNPFCYGLLGDKRRMVLWSDREALGSVGLDGAACDRIVRRVPLSRMLSELDRDEVWKERNGLVFKPVARFGSRGVLLGRKASRKRFDTLEGGDTLVQRAVPPSLTPAGEGAEMKTDFRLYVYRNQVLGLAARLYQGQVTNMRTPGGGFARVELV